MGLLNCKIENSEFCRVWMVLVLLALSFQLVPTIAAGQVVAETNVLVEIKAALQDELYDLARKKTYAFLKKTARASNERAEGTLLLAQAMCGQKQYQAMIDLLLDNKKLFAGTSREGVFKYWLAFAYVKSEQWPRILESVAAFEEQYPDSPYRPQVLRLRAWAFENSGKLDQALACYARFAKEYGNTADGPANLLDWGQTLIAAGSLEQARGVLEQLMASGPEGRLAQECQANLGRIYLALGDHTRAQQTFTPLSRQKNVPDEIRAVAIQALADIAEDQTNYVAALSLLDKGLKQMSDPVLKGKCNLMKGKILLEMGKVDEGVVLIRGFVLLLGTNAVAQDIQMELAQTLLSMGLNEKALNEYQNFLEAFPATKRTVSVQQGKGWALFNLGRYREAADTLNKALAAATEPGLKARLQSKAGDCFFACDQYKLAMEAYQRAILLTPDDRLADTAQFQIAECYSRQGDLIWAEELFRDLAAQYADNPIVLRAFLRIAELNFGQGKLKEARAVYRQILDEFGGQERAYALQGLGRVDYQEGEYAKALDNFMQVLRLFPESQVADLAYYMSGWCHYMLGHTDRALTTFREFVKRYPQSDWAADALFWLCEYDYNSSRYKRAERGFLGLVRRYPDSALADRALFWAGKAALMQKEYRRANFLFARLVKEYPASKKRAEARYYQGETLCELGEFASAILVFDEIIKQFPESELGDRALFRKGDSQFTLGPQDGKRYAEAIMSYQALLDKSGGSVPSKMQAEYKIALCHEKMENNTKAFEGYMKVVYAYFANAEDSRQGNVWFVRSAFAAASMKEAGQSWRKAVAIYQRVVDADILASADALERINKIRNEHWLSFY